jgi:hypothetical protein
MTICKWCGKKYKKNHNAQLYCSEYCSKNARQEQNRIHFRKYYHKYKSTMNEDKKYGLGSGGLNSHCNPNHKIEHNLIQKELRRIKNKSITHESRRNY